MNTTQYEDVSEQCSLAELIENIEQIHHRFTRDQLQRIKLLIHGLEPSKQIEASELIAYFDALNADLVPHLLKEEHILFPYIVAMETDSRSPPVSCFGRITNPIRMMQIEHASVKSLQEKFRKMTSDYAATHSQHDGHLTEIYAALTELDHDLMQHMHWEDDVLFPRAMEMEMQDNPSNINHSQS
ncbi:iron-sulfur cluster repair protein YtfE [mine drainage metagenome]|uniref:Iron-sulfur cluster repair protein YtfE n=1 Tax=mine drainage metagenome TaxID=410659 RepID=A0A1J5R131_9ZZZZ